MKTDRELNYRLYVQRNDGFQRNPFEREMGYYRAVQNGDIDEIERRFADIKDRFFEDKGILSKNPLRNAMYHFVTSVALVSRYCIEGGLEHGTAYTLADIYIQKADSMQEVNDVVLLFREMQIDYATRMRSLRKNDVVSLHIRRCIDYIYEHLQEKITVEMLAEQVGLNPSYLSKLFASEKGVGVHEFITQVRIQTAENLLRNTNFSNAEIALALGFSSQSAFISVFRKHHDMTPKKYRELHYSEIIK